MAAPRLRQARTKRGLALEPFVENLCADAGQARVPRRRLPVANPTSCPRPCCTTSSTTRFLHERNLLLTVRFDHGPPGGACGAPATAALAPGFWRVTLSYGFMEQPDVPRDSPAAPRWASPSNRPRPASS